MRKVVLLLMAIVLSVSHIWAQERTITGKVTDDKGNPIPGASIIAKGTNLGTSSATDGSFSIKVPSTAKALIVSSIGLGEKEKAIAALERAFQERSDTMAILKAHPLLEPLRSDARFIELEKRVGY